MDKWDRKTGFCCSTCAYYAPKTQDKGRCRRHAPTMQGYPVVYAEDWCGDHKIGSNPSKEPENTITYSIEEQEETTKTYCEVCGKYFTDKDKIYLTGKGKCYHQGCWEKRRSE